MPQKELIHSIGAHDEGRIDLVVARLTQFSRSRVRGLMLHGGVSLDGETIEDAGFIVHAGHELKISYDPVRKYAEPPKAKVTSKNAKFQIVYQDQTIVVVNKEAGLLTVPTDKRESQNLLDLLSNFLHPNRRSKLSLVHRLDRETSGLLVFGEDQAAAQHLIKQFSDRKPERVYAAIVKGQLKEKLGTIRSHLETDKALNQKSNRHGRGELAITHYEVLETYKSASLVKVTLETGRRNQIRVHFAELGHPILGDMRYQKDKAEHPGWPYNRLALHARSLGLIHPKTGEKLFFEQELPLEFQKFQSREKPTSSQRAQALD